MVVAKVLGIETYFEYGAEQGSLSVEQVLAVYCTTLYILGFLNLVPVILRIVI